jgi:hypothetical protein
MRLLAFLLLASPAFGADLAAECGEVNGVPTCVMAEADLDQLIASNHRAKVIIEQAMKRIAELEAKPPKCAEVEITKPSKNVKPKAESNS